MPLNIYQKPFTNTLKKKVHEGFRKHALEMTGLDGDKKTFSFSAYKKGSFAGIVVVKTFWGQLHIKYLYVEEIYRRKGIGTRLILNLLEYGKQQGSTAIFVETMSFQALGFYQKLGFEVELNRTGFIQGITHHYLRKNL